MTSSNIDGRLWADDDDDDDQVDAEDEIDGDGSESCMRRMVVVVARSRTVRTDSSARLATAAMCGGDIVSLPQYLGDISRSDDVG